jgi:Glycerate kinase
MAAALGYQFYDHDNRLIEPLPSAFPEIHRIQAPAIVCIAKVIALADVETVLTGPEGDLDLRTAEGTHPRRSFSA